MLADKKYFVEACLTPGNKATTLFITNSHLTNLQSATSTQIPISKLLINRLSEEYTTFDDLLTSQFQIHCPNNMEPILILQNINIQQL